LANGTFLALMLLAIGPAVAGSGEYDEVDDVVCRATIDGYVVEYTYNSARVPKVSRKSPKTSRKSNRPRSKKNPPQA
jgi:hypothetical protein